MATVRQGEGVQGDKSTETFITALVTHSAIATAEILAFLILRRRFGTVYEPRHTLHPHGPKQDALPRGFFSVIPAIIKANDEDIIRHNGLDAYLYVRFNKLMVMFFVPVAILTWAVLLPVYGTSTAGNEGINRFTFGNVGRDQQARLAAPLVLAWVMTLFLLWLIYREWKGYVTKRHAFLTSRGWITKPSARTVLITGLPSEYRSIEGVQKLTSYLQGGVAKIWMARDVDDVSDLYERQMDAAQKLEKADVKVIKKANKLVRKDKVSSEGDASQEKDGMLASRYIKEKKLPHHRLGKIPFIGKKVATIPWAEKELEDTNRELQEARREGPSKYNIEAAAFILFNDQVDAHIFAQGKNEENHSKQLKLCKRFINVDPQDVVWSNMNRKPAVNKALHAVSVTLTVLLIVFWSPLTVFVTGVANVSNLCSTVSFLGWLCTLPTPVNGILQGVLPPLVLIILFALVPPLFRFMGKLQGTPLNTMIELSLQRRYFAFLFVQGFIIATLSSGIVAGISQITSNPSSTVSLLANNLPKASTFFLTFIVIQGFTKAFGLLLQVAKLVIYYLKVKLLGGDPRSLQKAKYSMPASQWGVAYPGNLLIAVIALSYSTIAPLVCGFALVAFINWYFVLKYNALYVFNITPETETAGLHFRTALNQLFAGIYIYELCLIGLFFLARNEAGTVSAAPEGGLMIALLIISILVQIWLNWKLNPTSVYLNTAQHDEHRAKQKEHFGAVRGHQAGNGNGITHVPTSGSDHTAVQQESGIAGQPAKGQPGRDVEDGAGQKQSKHSEDDVLGELNENAFEHPALWREQPTIWLPRDPLHISQDAVRRARAKGILITDDDATLDDKGKVDISRETVPGEDFNPNL